MNTVHFQGLDIVVIIIKALTLSWPSSSSSSCSTDCLRMQAGPCVQVPFEGFARLVWPPFSQPFCLWVCALPSQTFLMWVDWLKHFYALRILFSRMIRAGLGWGRGQKISHSPQALPKDFVASAGSSWELAIPSDSPRPLPSPPPEKKFLKHVQSRGRNTLWAHEHLLSARFGLIQKCLGLYNLFYY